MKSGVLRRIFSSLLCFAMIISLPSANIMGSTEERQSELSIDGETLFVSEDSIIDISEEQDMDDLMDLELGDNSDEENYVTTSSSDPDDPGTEEFPLDISGEETADGFLSELDYDLDEGLQDSFSEAIEGVEEDIEVGEVDESEDYISIEEPFSTEGIDDNNIDTTGVTNGVVDELEMGASEATISITSSNFSIKRGNSKKITVSISGCSGDVYLSCSSINSTSKASWDPKWVTKRSIGLTISGISKGTNIFSITLRQAVTNKILASKTITVSVTDSPSNKLTLSSTSVNVATGYSLFITVSCSDYADDIKLSRSGGSLSTSAEWKQQSNSGGVWSVKLKITGLRAGKSVYTISMLRKTDNKLLNSATLTINVTSNAKIAVVSNAAVQKGSNVKINVTGSGYKPSFYLSATRSNQNCTLSWGKPSGNTFPLTISGVSGGTTTITFRMLDKKTDAVLANASMKVTVNSPNPQIKASSSTVNISAGNTSKVTLTAYNFTGKAKVAYSRAGSSASASFGEASGASIPLYIKGLSQGTTVFTIYLKNSSGTVIASTRITVNVSASAKIICDRSSVSINQGSSISLRFSHSNANYGVKYSANVPKFLSAEWGKFNDNGNACSLTITGNSAGSGYITVYLVKTSDKSSVASVQVPVTVKALSPSLSASPTSVEIGLLGTRDISIRYSNAPANSKIAVGFNKSGILKGEFPYLGGRTLRLTGIGSGSVTVTIAMMDQSLKTTYVKTTIQATVSGYQVGNLSYSFSNSREGFGYSDTYRIPLASYQLMFGKTTLANQLYNEHTGWGGNCFGMTTTAAMIATSNGLNASSFRSGAKKASDLKVSDTTKINGIATTLKKVIEGMQVSQYASSVQRLKIGVDNNLQQLVNLVKSGKLTVIGYSGWAGKHDKYGNRVGSGHAVLGYSFVGGSGADYIYVYDPNSPMNSSRRITLYKNKSGSYTSWAFDINGYSTGTNYQFASIRYVTYENAIKIWNSRGTIKDTSLDLLAVNSDCFNVYDVEDSLVFQVVDGIIELNNAGAETIDIYDAAPSQDYLIYLPSRYYRIENKDDTIDIFDVSMTNIDLGAHVITTGNEVNFAVEDNSDLNEVIMFPEQGEAYQVELLSSRAGDTSNVQVNGIGDGSEICVKLDGGVLSTDGATDAMINVDGAIANGVEIIADAGTGGTIFPIGNVAVSMGANQTFRIIPNAAYRIEDVIVDGKSVGAVDKYRFESITQDHTVKAIFTHDHIIDSGRIVRAATCNKDGEKVYYCTVCGEAVKHELIPKTNEHVMDSGKIAKVATCTEDGDKIYYCTICGEVIKHERIAQDSHSWGSWRVSKTASVLAEGQEQRTCRNCGSVETRNIKKIKATIILNATGTLPLKTKQKCKKVSATLEAGDSIKTVVSNNSKIVKGFASGNTIVLKAGSKTGKATVTITTAAGAEKSLKIKVQKGKVKTKTINNVPKSISLTVGKQYKLKPEITPISTAEKVKYKSSKKSIASVSGKGVIKAKKAGKAVVTVTCGKKKVKCIVKIIM